MSIEDKTSVQLSCAYMEAGAVGGATLKFPVVSFSPCEGGVGVAYMVLDIPPPRFTSRLFKVDIPDTDYLALLGGQSIISIKSPGKGPELTELNRH